MMIAIIIISFNTLMYIGNKTNRFLYSLLYGNKIPVKNTDGRLRTPGRRRVCYCER